MATSKEKRREYSRRRAQRLREERERQYRQFFHDNRPRHLWEYYRDKAPEGSKYAKVTDQAVTNMLETIVKYEKYVQLKEREFKRILKEKDQKIKEQERRIKELERQLKDQSKRKLEHAHRMDAVSERAGEDFKAIKAKAHAAFRGDNFAEKAGEGAANKKDPYEKLIQTIHERRRIWIHPNRRQSLMNSEKFRSDFVTYMEDQMGESEIEELWNYHFGESRMRSELSQYGLSSDTDENWDFNYATYYGTDSREYHQHMRDIFERDKALNKPKPSRRRRRR